MKEMTVSELLAEISQPGMSLPARLEELLGPHLQDGVRLEANGVPVTYRKAPFAFLDSDEVEVWPQGLTELTMQGETLKDMSYEEIAAIAPPELKA